MQLSHALLYLFILASMLYIASGALYAKASNCVRYYARKRKQKQAMRIFNIATSIVAIISIYGALACAMLAR